MTDRAVILAGGRGQRLYPFTAHLPKPLLPIGDRPVLEIILQRLVRFGIRRVTLAVAHMAPLIEAYFGDGTRFGLRLDYVREEEPLGTGGALARLDAVTDSLLVMNADILTDLDISAMLREHRAANAVLTVASRTEVLTLASGMLQTDELGRVLSYREKPSIAHRVGLGVYILEPEALHHLPPRGRFDMPDLIGTLIQAGKLVSTFDHKGCWIDIGRPEDFARAQSELAPLEPVAAPAPARHGSVNGFDYQRALAAIDC